MPATVVVGMFWGDEGKGKIVDYLAKDADLIARYNGGDNAGHTVYVGDQKFALHLLPSGVVRGKKIAIGARVVVNPDSLKEEINYVKSKGVKIDLIVDERADVITKKHVELDQANKKGAIGSTGKGIGPCHEDSVGRRGIRMIDYAKEHPEFKRLLGNVSLLVNDYLDKGKNVLMEGAQGSLLSVKWGTYPFVTSSEPIAGGACTGLGVGPKRIDRVIGVAKAFVSRVGNGPFPTELGGERSEEHCKDKNHQKLFELQAYGIPYEIVKDEKSKEEKIIYDHFDGKILCMMNHDDDFLKGVGLRLAGDEYGTTTQRPRRTGWFDVVAAKHSCRINGIEEIALTKLDVLDFMNVLKISNYYKIDGEPTDVFPTDNRQLKKCKPIYAINVGWKERTNNVRFDQDLPYEAGDYVDIIQHFLKTPITMIGVGQERDQLIVRKA